MKVINHPLIAHQLTIMRDKNTNSTLFRLCLKCLSFFLAYEVTANLKTKKIKIQTPISMAIGEKNKTPIILVPILRAGLGMVDGFKEAIPFARIGHIGMYREKKTQQPIQYYAKFPVQIKNGIVIILDPMLATGKTITKAIDIIKKHHPQKIKFCSVVSCKKGIEYLHKYHPDVELYTAAIDKKLNKNKYIVPGLGDAGDRIFGTK